MSLDQNLFTLHLTQHKDHPNVVDLVDPSDVVHYRKQRILGIPEYKAEVYGTWLYWPLNAPEIKLSSKIRCQNPCL
jgi:hypothetical protein